MQKMSLKVGDKVSVLHDTIRGEVTALLQEGVVIVDEDGFERRYELQELAFEQSSDYNFDEELTERAIQSKLKDSLKERQGKSTKYTQKNYIDLHIEELVDDHRLFTNFEIVQVQMEACKRFIRKALDSKTNKLYIIHGKGEGVLKSEVHAFLMKLRSENGVSLEFHDGPYHEFGMGGATEVILH